MYVRFFKRVLDVALSLSCIALLSPLLVLLCAIGAVTMRGNPFFVQCRPGKIGRDGRERIFPLLKFRTMDNCRDREGNLLPDEVRLHAYGRFLRATSLDELPELFNILLGHMSLVGPRPLLVQYLERYTPEQRRRHTVRPGLTGYAQAYGRNALSWEDRFRRDVYYVEHISFWLDVKIVLVTVVAVVKREGVSFGTAATMEEFMGNESEEQLHA